MFVTSEYYVGWLGGFILGTLSGVVFSLLMKSDDDLNDSFSEEDENDGENGKEAGNEQPENVETTNQPSVNVSENVNLHGEGNIFYFKLSDESVKAFMSNDNNVIENFTNFARKEEVNAEEEYISMLEKELDLKAAESFKKQKTIPEPGTAAPVFHTSKAGGYATFADLDIAVKTYKAAEVSAERLVLSEFRDLVGMNYSLACNVAGDRGYFLYPIYHGLKRTTDSATYSKDVLGVRIKDDDFQYWPDGQPRPSVNAVVTEVIDVGGNDRNNRGAVNL